MAKRFYYAAFGVFTAIIFWSCSKLYREPANMQNQFSGFNQEWLHIPYDSSNPLAGDWALIYSDGGTCNCHIVSPKDTFITLPDNRGYYTWPSHLFLLANDSAGWSSGGVDEEAVWFYSGLYSAAMGDKGASSIDFSFNFNFNNVSTYSYQLKGTDTLVLDDLLSPSTFYTYVRK